MTISKDFEISLKAYLAGKNPEHVQFYPLERNELGTESLPGNLRVSSARKKDKNPNKYLHGEMRQVVDLEATSTAKLTTADIHQLQLEISNFTGSRTVLRKFCNKLVLKVKEYLNQEGVVTKLLKAQGELYLQIVPEPISHINNFANWASKHNNCRVLFKPFDYAVNNGLALYDTKLNYISLSVGDVAEPHRFSTDSKLHEFGHLLTAVSISARKPARYLGCFESGTGSIRVPGYTGTFSSDEAFQRLRENRFNVKQIKRQAKLGVVDSTSIDNLRDLGQVAESMFLENIAMSKSVLTALNKGKGSYRKIKNNPHYYKETNGNVMAEVFFKDRHGFNISYETTLPSSKGALDPNNKSLLKKDLLDLISNSQLDARINRSYMLLADQLMVAKDPAMIVKMIEMFEIRNNSIVRKSWQEYNSIDSESVNTEIEDLEREEFLLNLWNSRLLKLQQLDGSSMYFDTSTWEGLEFDKDNRFCTFVSYTPSVWQSVKFSTLSFSARMYGIVLSIFR